MGVEDEARRGALAAFYPLHVDKSGGGFGRELHETEDADGPEEPQARFVRLVQDGFSPVERRESLADAHYEAEKGRVHVLAG